MDRRPFTFWEFFAGGGLARAGLGEDWSCLFANDIDPKKAAVYRANWGGEALLVGDVGAVRACDVAGAADLAWASFPCQDLSLAGGGRGLGRAGENAATRSGAFWPFWRLIEALAIQGRGPKVVVLENVAGVLTANSGRDFAAIAEVLANGGYRFGALMVDAKGFLPQSRPRAFFIAVRAGIAIPPALLRSAPYGAWASRALIEAQARLPEGARRQWAWWDLPRPDAPPPSLAVLLEAAPVDVAWDTPTQTRRLLSMMSPANVAKVEAAVATGARMAGTAYRRTRPAPGGGRRVRCEVRFDGVAGCLRTPSGGSSRQKVLMVEGGEVRSRLLSGREAARLMGLPDSYRLPARYNDAYHVAGDGVAAPVVRHLARHLIEPVIVAADSGVAMAAE